MKITSDELITDNYVFFYAGVFSQWHPCDFDVELLGRKLHLNCAEQGMMLAKAILFQDDDIFKAILNQKRPSVQKALGRKVKGFDKKIWDEASRRVVYTVNFAKFSSTPEMKIIILSTGDRKFVEASPTDAIWGIKRSIRDPLIHNPKNWRGTNWLGEVLDDVKDGISRMSQ